MEEPTNEISKSKLDIEMKGNEKASSKSNLDKIGSKSRTNLREPSSVAESLRAPSTSKIVEREMLTMTEDSSLEHCHQFLKERHFFHDFAEVFVELYKMEDEERPADPMKFILKGLIHNLPQMKKFSAMVLSFTSRLEDLKTEKQKILRQIRYYEHKASKKAASRKFDVHEPDASDPTSEPEDWLGPEDMQMEGEEQTDEVDEESEESNDMETSGIKQEEENTEGGEAESSEDAEKEIETQQKSNDKPKSSDSEVKEEVETQQKSNDKPKSSDAEAEEVTENEEYTTELDTEGELAEDTEVEE